jgi:FMN phosphatase YigB (HAD superfamily)
MTFSPKITTVLFDIGGVLYTDPWETLLLSPHGGIAKLFHLDPKLMEEVGQQLWWEFSLSESRESDYWRQLARRFGISLPDDFTDRLQGELLCVNPAANQILSAVVAKGLSVGIISDNTSFWYERQNDALELSRFVSPELQYLSFRVGLSKLSADKDLFDFAAQFVVPHSTLVVDDRSENLMKARSKGFEILPYQVGTSTNCHLAGLFS